MVRRNQGNRRQLPWRHLPLVRACQSQGQDPVVVGLGRHPLVQACRNQGNRHLLWWLVQWDAGQLVPARPVLAGMVGNGQWGSCMGNVSWEHG